MTNEEPVNIPTLFFPYYGHCYKLKSLMDYQRTFYALELKASFERMIIYDISQKRMCN